MTADQARLLGQRELFECLEQLLIETRGNIAEIARRLGKDRSTVRYHLRRFGMLGEDKRRPGTSRALASTNGHAAERAQTIDEPEGK